ncbi:MAG: TM0106 family RecB-like putative nuclease, partial [Acidimicrobiia bacterium]|nr:TM0106 family RecB-like putative nuclease [Acidimicrobiia bacterium]
VDVKHHPALRGTGSALTSPLATPFPSVADTSEHELYPRKRNALQLAHYRRMLEALDMSASAYVGGIIGKEGVVDWYQLDEPIWNTPSKNNAPRTTKERTTLEAYDFEFEFRRDMAARAHRFVDGEDIELLLPIRISDCASCGWRDHCNQSLEAGFGDTSLLPRIGYKEWRKLRDADIDDRNDVAGLDYRTAQLQTAGVDTDKWLKLAKNASPDTNIERINGRARKQVEILQNNGIATAADLIDAIDTRTAAIGEAFLTKAILNARAAIGEHPVYTRPDAPSEPIPRADIEIDVDMENTGDGVYMWGVLVTDCAKTGLIEEGYHAFHSWESLRDDVEMKIFHRFWVWITDLMALATENGVSVKAYCWYDPAENTQLRRIAQRAHDLVEDVEAFIASGHWVDLKKEFDTRYITGESTGLKMVAPLAGFEWGGDDPGGAISMLRHRDSIRGDEAAQKWLLTYNQGDVEATKAIREWLAEASIPELQFD